MSDADAYPAVRRELEGSVLQLSPVGSLAEAMERAETAAPDLLLVDGKVSGPDWVALRELFEAHDGALRVFMPPETTGPWMTVAHRSEADAVLPVPLQRTSLLRLLNDPPGRRPAEAPVALPDLVDRSDAMQEVWRLVSLASQSDASVTITGETGVGKEIVARALHRFSRRRHGPFVAVNCAALPEPLLESELFGHEKGAFTGAVNQRKGRFELADGGTLFLDEVGDLPLSLQVKLLRVLQERTFERLGGTRTLSVDVRVVAATHRDLEESVQRERFRADLFFRIRVLSIRVPSLRRRREDILPLWNHYIDEGARREGRPVPDTGTPAQRRLLRHAWPGNVRELQNSAQHALMMVGSGPILPADLPDVGSESPDGGGVGELAGMTLRQVERAAILETYTALRSVKATAQSLGVSERKLHYRLREYREEGVTADRVRLPSSSRATDPEGPESTLPRVVLADDDDELRWGLHDFLKCSGFQVTAVQDGRGLLEYLGSAVLMGERDPPPDAIITDVRMPFLTGLELLQKVRERGWQTKMVVISAFGDDDLRRRALSMGAAAFFDKPIDTDALLQVLERITS